MLIFGPYSFYRNLAAVLLKEPLKEQHWSPHLSIFMLPPSLFVVSLTMQAINQSSNFMVISRFHLSLDEWHSIV
jgi:hypothetical protein